MPIAAFAILVASGCTSLDRPAPDLQVDRDSVDLGDFAMGDWAETTFVLRNVGTEALEFQRPPWGAVEGMPLGSAGMESPSGRTVLYDVLAFDEDRETSLYARYRGAVRQ